MERIGFFHCYFWETLEIFCFKSCLHRINILLWNIFFQAKLHQTRCFKRNLHTIGWWNVFLQALFLAMRFDDTDKYLQAVEPIVERALGKTNRNCNRIGAYLFNIWAELRNISESSLPFYKSTINWTTSRARTKSSKLGIFSWKFLLHTIKLSQSKA